MKPLRTFFALALLFASVPAFGQDFTSNLKRRWLCNDNAASTTVVAQVGGQNGTLTGAGNTSAATTTGPTATITAALTLNGASYIDTANIDNDSYNVAKTIALWLTPSTTSPSGNQFIACKQNGSGNFAGYYFYREGTSAGDPYVWGYFSGATEIAIQSPCTNTTNWRHVAVVNSGAGNASGLTIYEDGQPATRTIRADQAMVAVSSIANFQIGSRGGTNLYACAVADVRVYDRALSAADIAALFAGTSPVPRARQHLNEYSLRLPTRWQQLTRPICETFFSLAP